MLSSAGWPPAGRCPPEGQPRAASATTPSWSCPQGSRRRTARASATSTSRTRDQHPPDRRGWWSRATVAASTTVPPARSRVRNELAAPARPRSRNSSRVACEPTVTMQSAPLPWASRIAVSSVVSRDWKRVVPGSAGPVGWGSAPGRVCTTTWAPGDMACTPAEPSRAVGVGDHDVGAQPRSTQGVGAAVHADQDGPAVGDEGPQPAQVLGVAVAADADHDGSAGQPDRQRRARLSPSSSRSRSTGAGRPRWSRAKASSCAVIARARLLGAAVTVSRSCSRPCSGTWGVDPAVAARHRPSPGRRRPAP